MNLYVKNGRGNTVNWGLQTKEDAKHQGIYFTNLKLSYIEV